MSARPAGTHQTVLATRGAGGHRQYRIPALAVTAAGTLLAVYDGRPTLDDLPSPADLVLRRSTDGGRTWEAQRTLRTGTGLHGFGDPSLLVDGETGTIFCFHAATTRWGFFESLPGTAQTQHVDLSASTDDGLSWSHRRITGQLKRPGIRGIFAASGAGTRVSAGPHAGRLLQPCVVLLSAGGRIAAAVAHSDDHGHSWKLGEALEPSADGTHTNESSVAALPDGSVLLHSRATPHRLAARSVDGGATFSRPEPVPALPDPSDNGSLTALAGGGMVATHNAHRHLRRNTVLRHSPDDGTTWAGSVLLCAGASAYSTAAELPDGSIGVLYERGAYEEIVFARIPRAELGAPAVTNPADDDTNLPHGPRPLPGHPEVRVEVVPRSITPAPPDDWTFSEPHLVLGRADAGYGAAGKEVGQAEAQLVASRADLLANYGPPAPGIRAGDILTYSAAVTNSSPDPVTVRPHGDVEGPSQSIAPGATAVWLHLNHRTTAAGARPRIDWAVESSTDLPNQPGGR
ncbi:glycoside hydrolase [Paeniglutamicibacter sp. ABSL32-1]|uniref:sialidase family protein n=1 Tax=Paeniglutamicibacter quisquiliarum TaxID=2849498 RepID=UPI001C2D7540|nr:glycoside hydrolase [Paeniglutamicibacter quisquiliarum]